MEIPNNVSVTETETSAFWLDQNGILCVVSKKGPPQTIDDIKITLAKLYSVLNGKKACMLIDVSNSGESTKEVRDFAAEEFPKFVKAIALVSSSELGRMLANLFFNIKQQPYPTKMFTDETEAREWLRQYM
jgi:hypothetical protein